MRPRPRRAITVGMNAIDNIALIGLGLAGMASLLAVAFLMWRAWRTDDRA